MNKAIFALCAFLVLPVMGLSQNWSGIIASSRAENWQANAGLPATFPDGETTASPWQPPARTTICSTLTTSTTIAAINSALSSCPAGQVVLLAAGTYSFSSGSINLGNSNNVTLRGAGADQTIFKCSGTCGFSWENTGESQSSQTWTGGLSQDSTSLTFGGNTGLAANQTTVLAANGVTTDSGGVYVCSNAGTCSTEAGNNQQTQTVLITGGSGDTWTISPEVYMPNWASLGSPTETWTTTSVGTGLEDMTLDFTSNTGNSQIYLSYCYACWIKGNRIINGNGWQIQTQNAKNYLVANNYFYGATTLVSGPPGSIDFNTDSDGLTINNIAQMPAAFYWEGGAAGDVITYNYFRDAYSNSGTQCYPPVIVSHESGVSYILFEGNEVGGIQMDDIHGTQNLDTFFRNLLSSNDPPYTSGCNAGAIQVDGYARFMNMIGNVLGSGTTTSYQDTPSSSPSNPVYIIGTGGINDTVAFNSSFRWGNYDVVTGAVRWCGNSSDTGWSTTCASTSEVPTTLSGNAAPFENAVPSSTTLPASFFMPTTAHPSGGTGLSWWQVCTNYPTCSTSQTQPFPPIGPDVTGGTPVIGNTTDIYAGHANDIPAALAWKYLPIDTSYQATYSITGSTWSGGTETLTISGGFPGGFTPKGEFQLTGTCAGTFVMNGSSNTTVSYAVASNPGTCSGGSLKYPDVRQFNETVYENDGVAVVAPAAPAAPTGLQAVVH